MGVHDESTVVVTEVRGTGNFYLDHLKSLFSRSTRHIDIIISILNIKYNEFTETISATESTERVFPIRILIYFVCSHCKYVNYLHKCRYFIY